MDKLRLSPIALDELKEAIDWYVARSPAAADRFAETVDAAMDAILAAPLSFPQLNERYRYVQLRPFPYIIAFGVRGDVINVVRIRHTSQRDFESES